MLEDDYKRAIVVFNNRDLDGWLELMHEDVEIESRFSRMHNRFRGHTAVRRWWDDLDDAWEYLDVELETVREVAPDQTLALINLHGRGRGSGLEMREPAAHRVTWRDGRWTRLQYEDRDVAERELSAKSPVPSPEAPGGPGR
jgi:ketosteroid isomerase-like protein